MAYFCQICIWMLALVFLKNSGAAALEDEISSNSVTLTFYMLSKNEWSDKELDFKMELVTQANGYCQENSEKCGLKAGTLLQMNTSNYMLVDGYPTSQGQNCEVQIYLKFPNTIGSSNLSSSATTKYVLNKKALQAIVLVSRATIRSKVGSWIVFIDGDRYSPPPNTEVNEVVIPVACVMTLLIFLLALVLYRWHKSEMKKAKKKQREENRNKRRTNLVSPMATGKDKHWNGSTAGTEQWYISESDQHTNNSASQPYHTIEVPDITNHHGIMEDINEESAEKRRKDKKKKKHKKHRKQGREQENAHETGAHDAQNGKSDLEKRQLISDQIQMAALSGENKVNIEDSGSDHEPPATMANIINDDDYDFGRNRLSAQGLM